MSAQRWPSNIPVDPPWPVMRQIGAVPMTTRRGVTIDIAPFVAFVVLATQLDPLRASDRIAERLVWLLTFVTATEIVLLFNDLEWPDLTKTVVAALARVHVAFCGKCGRTVDPRRHLHCR